MKLIGNRTDKLTEIILLNYMYDYRFIMHSAFSRTALLYST